MCNFFKGRSLHVVAVFFFLIYLGETKSTAQLKFHQFSIDEGLSQVSCNALLQDNRGFIWVGTENGLNYFDGYKFSNFFHDATDSTSLSENYIRSLFQDSKGNLWIGTNGGGLNLFNYQTHTFQDFKNKESDSSTLSNNIVLSILEDSKGNLWIGTRSGLNLYNYETNKFQTVNNSLLKDSRINSIYEDSNGLWVGTANNGLLLYDHQNQTFKWYLNQKDNPTSISSNNISVITSDLKGNLWVGTDDDGLNHLDVQTQQFSSFQNEPFDASSISGNKVTSLFYDSHDNFWVGTWGRGLNLFDIETKSFTHVKPNSDPTSLSSNTITHILEDKSGNLWVGTYGGGLNLYDYKNQYFNHARHIKENPNSLSNNFVRSLWEDNEGNLWIGTNGGGLNFYNTKNKEFTSYKSDINNPSSISDNSIRVVMEDSKSNIWIGTNGHGLSKLDRNRGVFYNYDLTDNNKNVLGTNRVISLFEDSKNNLWVGTNGGGLGLFNPENETFTWYQQSKNNPKSISHNAVWYIYEDSQNKLWIGTFKGLELFDAEAGTFTHFKHDESDSTSISHDFIKHILEDSKGRFWIATAEGFNLMDRELRTFKQFTKQDGLSNDLIYAMLEDDQQNLWLSTNVGVNKFNPEENSFTWYDKLDGLQSNEFNTGAFHKGKSGKMYLGGINGFNTFYPKEIKENKFIPEVVLTDFFLFNKPVTISESSLLQSHIGLLTEIELEHDDYIFGIEFSALNYLQAEKNKFAYKLEGFDKKWIYTDYKYRRATYSNIPAGTYTFRVKASNDDGYWNEEGASIKLIIKPAWWNTWIAKSIWALIAIAIALNIYFVRIIRLKKQKESLEREVAKRTAEISKQNERLTDLNREKDGIINVVSHDLKTPLNNIDGLIKLLALSGSLNEEQKGHIERINKIVKRSNYLINDLMDVYAFEYADDPAKKTDVNIKHFINECKNGFGSEFIRKKQQLVIDIPADLSIKIDEVLLSRVMDNLISNAVKFSKEGKSIYIKARQHLDVISISVRDEGPGISKKEQQSMFKMFQKLSARPTSGESSNGLGLSIIKVLIKKLDGKISVNSKLGEGTKFIIKLKSN